jgi:fructose-specific PTS system IIC-like component
MSNATAEEVVAAMWQRERSQNTSLGDGIALPHATLLAAERTHLGVFTTAAPIDYQADDGQKTDVFFVTLGAPGDRQEHLILLSSIAKLVTGSDLVERLRAATSDAELLAVISECARQVDLD